MKLLVILFFTLFSFNAFSEGLPHTKLYAVTDGFCCGGEESDPHAVHGFEVMNNGFVLSGKSIDSAGTEEGFVIKFPNNLPDERIFLSPDEEYSFDWVYLFGSPGKRDGANGAVSIFDSVFVAGYSENDSGVINGYLAKVNLQDGKLKWEKSFESMSKNKSTAFESILITSDQGLILSGVTNSHKDSFEGFKSYGNPQSGETLVMYFDKESLISDSPPTKPSWEITLKNSRSGITIKEITEDNSFAIATKTNNEEGIAKIIKIDSRGKVIWSKKYPNFGEITDIDVSSLNGREDGILISGHKHDDFGGIDGSIGKVSLDGKLIWNFSFGNPVGGKNKFSEIKNKNEKMVLDECWGISAISDGGAVMACGTGIEECEMFENDNKLYEQCSNDPRTTWRSLLIRVDKNGKQLWQHVDSFAFPGEEDEFDVPSTASEYVFITSDNHIASVVDLGFGIGLQILEHK